MAARRRRLDGDEYTLCYPGLPLRHGQCLRSRINYSTLSDPDFGQRHSSNQTAGRVDTPYPGPHRSEAPRLPRTAQGPPGRACSRWTDIDSAADAREVTLRCGAVRRDSGHQLTARAAPASLPVCFHGSRFLQRWALTVSRLVPRATVPFPGCPSSPPLFPLPSHPPKVGAAQAVCAQSPLRAARQPVSLVHCLAHPVADSSLPLNASTSLAAAPPSETHDHGHDGRGPSSGICAHRREFDPTVIGRPAVDFCRPVN